MVRDGIYYALAMLVAATVIGWLLAPAWAVVPLLLGAFFLWFFRDPERVIPSDAGAVVSPGDGTVTDISTVELASTPHTRISIFLNVFNVHVNRSPIAGTIESVEYRRGRFRNAMGAVSSEENEQNIVTVRGQGQTVVFKQIAGLLARRIVFWKSVGDRVARGERVGLIKFGSRVDVLLEPGVLATVQVGDRVRGGTSVIAQSATTAVHELATAGAEHEPRRGAQ
jgi:phosphatidylserine decarboxylase